MIIISILSLLLSNAVNVRSDISILYNRIAILILIYCILNDISSLTVVTKGIGLHGGLLLITNLTQIFHIFLFIVSILILTLTSFYPRKVWVSEYSSLKDLVLYKFVYYNTKIINKMGEHFKIIEYPLILLFIITGAIFLMSTNDLVSIFLAIELQSYGRAPSEACVEEVNFVSNNIALSSIFGSLWEYLPRVIAAESANNDSVGIADYKSYCKMGLPSSDTMVSGDSHGQVNEFDTYKVAQLGPNVLSRISQHLSGKLNVFVSRPYYDDCQKSCAYFNIEGIRAQSPKTIIPNTYTSQPRDLTAYEYNLYLMRGQSFHNSVNAKGSSRKSSTRNEHDFNVKDLESLNLEKDSASPLSVNSWIKAELDNYMNKSGMYNGIINILANPLFLQACYLEIKGKPGNMSKGVTTETLDGINLEWFESIAKEIKTGKFNFSPTRRVMIPKPGKKELRPLSVGNPREKIVQKALTMLMETIWDEKFSDNSYGFRPGKSLHQALYQLYRNGSEYNWVIQGDISKCFDKIPHKVIMKCIESNTVCDKTLQLIRKSLTAGYIDPENGKHIKTTEGTPQGSVFSPLLANIVLNELDKRMEEIKLSFERGLKRTRNKEYDRITSRIQALQKYQPGSPEIKDLAVQRRTIPSTNPIDPNFKRLMYLRYADDFVVLVIGSLDDAKHIKHLIADTLTKKCGLELHDDKTLITATKEGFKFLGAKCLNVSPIKAGLSASKEGNPAKFRMRMRIEIPINDLIKKLTINKFVRVNAEGLPTATARKDLTNFSHYEIISFYNHRIQGLINFYSFAVNLTSLRKIIMFLQLSCALTLALKHKIRTKKKAFNKFGRLLEDPETGIKLVIPTELKVKHKYAKKEAKNPDKDLKTSWFTKVTKSGLHQKCAICQSTNKVEMHHVRKVKDVRNKIRTGNSTYAQWEGLYKRKQVPLCAYHHDLLHRGDLNYADMVTIRKYAN